jgi:hypothetical protein
MQIAVYISLGITGILALLVAVLVVIRRWGNAILQGMRNRTALRGEDGLRGDGFANFRGRASEGYPLRGNAAVLLTARALYVTVLWPRRELEVPVERMRQVEVATAFMGSPEPGGIVVVHFEADGGEDAIGFTARGRPLWLAEIFRAARPHLRAVQGRALVDGAAAPKRDGAGGSPPPAEGTGTPPSAPSVPPA